MADKNNARTGGAGDVAAKEIMGLLQLCKTHINAKCYQYRRKCSRNKRFVILPVDRFPVRLHTEMDGGALLMDAC